MDRFCFRITKYNPYNRNSLGHYTVDEWTAISDLSSYDISWDEYEKIESAYSRVIILLLEFTGCENLKICGLESTFRWKEFEKKRIKGLKKEGKILFKDIINLRKNTLSIMETSIFIRFLLREMLGGLLIGKKIEIEVGYDYYMHVLTSEEGIADFLRNYKDDKLFIEEVNPDFFSKDEDWVKENFYNEEHLK